MQILSQMAVGRQRTVLLTIHQPSFRLLQTINRFLVLAKGNVIYHGEVSGMAGYFNGLGHTMPEHVSRLDLFFIKGSSFNNLHPEILCPLESFRETEYADKRLFKCVNT